ncbi:MAG: hypothetical protein VB078_11890 [Clostridiaceae bacterium]|nr:hypothetical protein [Clostridiaceae bacterium]
MFREQYDQLNKQVVPDKNLLQDTISRAKKFEVIYDNKVYSFRKPVIALVTICLCLSLVIPALAATVEPIYQLMYMVSPTVAQFFMPVQKSNEDSGIKMEVVSAYVHENTAEIYITMQDLTDDRIDETTDFNDSYSINRPFDSTAHCKRIGFDKSTKTATFLITIEEWGSKDITGDKITFLVNEFLSHKKSYENVEIPFDLSTAVVAAQVQTVYTTGSGGTAYENDDGQSIVLTPGQTIDRFPVEGIDITAIGYIDGKLHVQMAFNNRLKNDNHGFFFLVDSNGQRYDESYNIYFSNQYDNAEERIDYCEYVFDIPQEKISNYILYGDFVTSGMYTEGNWRVTFPLEQLNLERQ